MKRMILALCGGALALAAASVSAGGAPLLFRNSFEDGEGTSGLWVAGYYVGYERDLQPVAALDFDGLSHLMVGAVLPNADGSLATHYYIDNVNGPIWAQGAVDAAQAAGRQAILMIGGAGTIDGWRGAASAGNRAAFVANLVALADQYGVDGLDLDWEPIEAQDHAPLTALAQALRAARPNLILTLPVNVVNANFSNPADEAAFFAGIVPYLDQVNLMSYAMGYDYDGWHSWFSSPLDGEAPNTPTSIAHTVDYYLAAGVPAAKLGVGSGFYGTCYRNVAQPRVPVPFGSIVASDGAMSYRNIVANYLPAMTRSYDATAQSPWLGAAVGQGPQACTYVTYEDAQSIAAKGAWVRAQGLGGTIIWTISQGHIPSLPAGQRDPLLDAMQDAFIAP
jgi:chitinase